MALTKTEYHTFTGTVAWAKVYTPDEFRGTSKWKMNFYIDNEDDWKKYKGLGIQKKVKKDEQGEFFAAERSTTKLMKGNLVYFTPPIIMDKDGNEIVKYVDEDGKLVRSYNEADKVVKRVGEPVLIGNGSKVEATFSVYPTAMGTGNRLESIKILDLITYEPENKDEGVVKPQTDNTVKKPKW